MNEIKEGKIEGERILEDDYPVYCMYLYTAVFKEPDGTNSEMVIRSQIEGTVKSLQASMSNCIAIKNCDIKARNLWEYAV